MSVGTSEGQKMALDALDLELQIVMGCHIGSGNHTLLLEEHQMLLTAEPSPQAPVYVNFCEKIIHKISHGNVYF